MIARGGTSFRDLKLVPNMAPVDVEFLFDSPRSMPSTRNPGETRYAYKLRILADHGEFREGDEVTYWTSSERHAATLNAFGRGDRITISYPQNPGDRYPSLKVSPMGELDGPIYSESDTAPAPRAGSVPREPRDPVKEMGRHIANAYLAIAEAATLLREHFGEEEGPEVAKELLGAMMTGDVVQKIAVTMSIEAARR